MPSLRVPVRLMQAFGASGVAMSLERAFDALGFDAQVDQHKPEYSIISAEDALSNVGVITIPNTLGCSAQMLGETSEVTDVVNFIVNTLSQFSGNEYQVSYDDTNGILRVFDGSMWTKLNLEPYPEVLV